MQHLQPDTTLQGGKYKIERVLGQGGFGITYLAIQSGLERKVAIKEFFMKELCERDESTSHVTLGTSGSAETVARFREKFLKEARNIARLNHPNIVRIIDVFEENGTAYYVMEYAENGSLSDKVKRESYLTEPMATRYILQVASALEYIHEQKMNHLDIKPANIMLNEKDEAVLIDFGLSKQYDAVTGNQTSTTPVGISHGYAPMEQYREGGVGEFSPETDIYALGATFFKLLTGATPPSASDVNEDGVPVDELKAKGVSQKAIDVICKAMEGRKKDRMKEVGTFIASLKGVASTTPHASAPVPTPVTQEEDEATLIHIDDRKQEEERKEAEAKAAKEKAEAEARAKDEAERKAREAEERKKREEEEKARKATQKSGSKNTWLYAVLVGVVVLIGIVIGVNSKGGSSSESSSNSSSDSLSSSTSNVKTATYSNGHEYVDLGLSVKWATCNVGADNPEDYGDYYAWGETETKTTYNWSTYKWCNGSYYTMTKYCTNSSYGTEDGKATLDPEDDVAHVKWGGSWRMPTKAEQDELRDTNNCTWTWTTQGGKNGYKVTSKKNGNSIFLPAAGCRYDSGLHDAGSYGHYWSSSLNSSLSYCANYLLFGSSRMDWYRSYRSYGWTVRPVCP